ncbi:MAG TPA: membrane dipeptidase [Tahibacter sp.]|uniref:dipeptidase n=1 Tax=Tahibacter sp. TaxID=2056211 RepID=UPI002B90C081|nr:membrane dipeptidase [Tahibacter sp.]HSX62691.1 membrane dipeptidase [Tahibacter sp.]
MVSRRDVLIGAGVAGLSAAFGVAAAPQEKPGSGAKKPQWPPYAKTFSIDGASAFGVIFTEDDADATAKELAIQRLCGLGAVLTTAAPQGRFWLDDAQFERTKDTVRRWNAIAERHAEHLYLVRGKSDLTLERRGARTGVILGFQGTEPLGEDLDRIALFRDLGVRVIQLTHNRRNLVGDGCMESGNAGLSNYGRSVVETLEAKKVVVDLAHGSPRTISEGIAACRRPMLISHTGCRALADLPRNVHDADLRAMADRGGVAGIIFWPYLRTDTQPMAIDVVRHIEHAIKVCGEDHVGIGTDLGVAPIERGPAFEKENRELIRNMVEDGIFEKGRPEDLYLFIPDLNTPDRFDTLAALLASRGHSDARIEKILGGNFARVMGEVWG